MPYLDYLLHEVLSTDKTEARRLTRHAKSFVLVEGELYKQSHTRILQRCIPIKQGKWLLSDIHSGICCHHTMPRTLVRNAFHQGFYWPTAVANAKQIVCTYEGCQYYARRPTCRPKHSKRSPSRGHSWSGGLIWSDLSRGRLGAIPTCLSP